MAEPRASGGDARPAADAAAADRHALLREIVLAADGLAGAERERLIDERSGGDQDLARAAREVLAGTPVRTRDVAPGSPLAAALAADETPARLGPFRIVREIGRGGMGVVYEAEDERDGRRVAVKAIREELLGNARIEERFAREAAAGAQVDHPNVVRTIGVERVEAARGAGRCLLVTELVEGRTLRALVRALGTVPESLVREIALGMARGLAAIHAAGVVHRDLKPENVLLTADGRVRIMDLGVARILDRSDGLTREGDFVGSPEYAAPEQCGGRPVGPAADLYALGVVLFEMTSGRNPFARPSALATVAAHLSQSAPPLAAEAEGVSEFLSAVVAKLLAKEPAARFEAAESLVRALAEAEDGAWWRERRAPADAASRPAVRVPVTRDLALRGRRKELAALLDAWDAARRGRETTVLLTGEPGLGKTRLLDAFLASVEPRESHRIYASFAPGGGVSGFGEALVGALGGIDADRWLRERASMPAGLAASFAAFLRSEPPPPGVAALTRDAAGAAFLRALRALAAERPTILALDDVHAAGPEAAALVLSLARGLAEAPVLLVLAARADGAARWTSELATLPGLRPLALSRLSSEDVVEILRDALGSEDLARRAARRIAAKSGGVPLYVAAMLAALRDAVSAAPAGGFERTLETIDVPMALRGALAARLAGLAPEERILLDACAVQGPRFDAAVAADVVGVPFVRALQTLASVEHRHGVVRADGRAFRFDHQLLADEVTAALPPALREEYHLRTATTLAARARPAAPPETLAFHFVESGRADLALPHVLPAIAALTARHENDAALRLAARVLSADGVLVGGARATLLIRVAELRNLVGDREAQAAAAREALDLAREARDPTLFARALYSVAAHLTTTGDNRGSIPKFRASIRLARRAGAAALEARGCIGISSAQMRIGRTEEARTWAAAACEIAERIGDHDMEQHARRSLGLLDLRVARFDEAREVFLRCIELARADGDLRAEGHAEGGLGVVEWQAGNWDAARQRFLVARDVSRTVGDRWLEVHALGSLAICLQAVGRCADALAANRELRPLVEAVGDRSGMALLLLNDQQAHLHLGEKEEAQRALEEGAAFAEATGFARARAQAALCRGEMAQEAGDLDGAERSYLEAESILAESDDPSGRTEALLSLGSVMRERGETARAAAYFDEAIAVGRTLSRPATRVMAEAARATLPGGDPAAACTSADLHIGDATYSCRMGIRHDLWLATRDRRQLEDARRLLAAFLEGVPPRRRRAAVANFRLHRDIAAACEAEGLAPVV